MSNDRMPKFHTILLYTSTSTCHGILHRIYDFEHIFPLAVLLGICDNGYQENCAPNIIYFQKLKGATKL
jgi:hypothetical protein